MPRLRMRPDSINPSQVRLRLGAVKEEGEAEASPLKPIPMHEWPEMTPVKTQMPEMTPVKGQILEIEEQQGVITEAVVEPGV